ncbi:MAG: hypothetical protein QW270_02365 [Candidatus Bathyarchaeia archaeon]
MKKKTAIIKVELVTESLAEPDEKIVKELFDWFHEEAIGIPWVKDVKNITVKGN